MATTVRVEHGYKMMVEVRVDAASKNIFVQFADGVCGDISFSAFSTVILNWRNLSLPNPYEMIVPYADGSDVTTIPWDFVRDLIDPDHQAHQERALRDARLQLGYAIAKTRQAQNMSQKMLGEKANLTQAYISRIEQGTANTTFDVLKKLALVLDVNVADLFDHN